MEPTFRLKFGANSKRPATPLYIDENPLLGSRENQPYVTCLDYNSANSSLLAVFSSPGDCIALLDATAAASNLQQPLRRIQTFKPHQDGTGTSTLVNTSDPSTFWSAGTDGRVIQCDMRTQPSARLILKGKWSHRRPFLSMDVSPDGNTVIAGTEKDGEDASIVFWDPRNPKQPLATHTSTHSDDITSLHFDPDLSSSSSDSRHILSGSTDGLLSLTNLQNVLNPTMDESNEDEDEDAVEHVANWGCSVARCGWIPGDGLRVREHQDRSNIPKIWSTSDMETMGLWSAELDPVREYGDVRQSSSPEQWKTDYVIDVKWVDKHRGDARPWGESGLLKWCGTNEGDVALLRLSHSDSSKWTIERILKNGHSDIVRSVCWTKEGVLFTGGEDGKICIWDSSKQDTQRDKDGDVEMVSGAEVGSPQSPGDVQRRRRSPHEDEPKILKRRKREE